MVAANGQPTIIRKEMGLTHKDFYEELPNLLKGIPYQHSENTIKFQINSKNIEITLGPEKTRHLGQSISLPVTNVTLSFSNFSKTEVNQFIKHFNLKFMKGGG